MEHRERRPTHAPQRVLAAIALTLLAGCAQRSYVVLCDRTWSCSKKPMARPDR